MIFTSHRTEGDHGYAQMAARMVELASRQPGFLGIESVRGAITESYWESEEAIRHWKQEVEHKVAQESGRGLWYQDYMIRVSRVDRAYGRFSDNSPGRMPPTTRSR